MCSVSPWVTSVLAQNLTYSRHWMHICWKKKWNLVERKLCLPFPRQKREKEREGWSGGGGEVGRGRERDICFPLERCLKSHLRYTNPMIDLGPWTPPQKSDLIFQLWWLSQPIFVFSFCDRNVNLQLSLKGAPILDLGTHQAPAASVLLDANIPNANIACCHISQYTILNIKSSWCLITLLKDHTLIHFKLWITFNSQLEQAAKFCFLCSQVAAPDAVENFQKYINSLGKFGKLRDAGHTRQAKSKSWYTSWFKNQNVCN